MNLRQFILATLFAVCALSSFQVYASGSADDFAISGHKSGHSLLAGEYEQSEPGVVGYVVAAVLTIVCGMVLSILSMESLGAGKRGAKELVMAFLAVSLGLVILALPLNPVIWLSVYYALNGSIALAQYYKGKLGMG